MKLLILLLGFSSVFADPSIQPGLLRKLSKTSSLSVMLNFESTEEILNKIKNTEYETRADRSEAVYNALNKHAYKTQMATKKYLKAENIEHQSFWISNSIHVPQASLKFVERMMKSPDIYEIAEEAIATIDPIENSQIEEIVNADSPWGITAVKANQAWDGECNSCGEGSHVFIIDTGVRGTHECLKDNLYDGYNWYDPSGKTTDPYDSNGHGTHCAGTAVGKDVGVAQCAKWSACLGCPNGSCPGGDLIKCAQWAICPHSSTDPTMKNCSQTPDVCSNSWGGGQGETWFDSSISAWRAAEIIPVFSQGNKGATCGSANSPGDNAEVIGVGSLAQSGNNIIMSSFSSRGPTTAGSGSRIKPDISAPGSFVLSSWHTSDTAYNSISGTSMACPHVAGAVAILRSKNPKATYKQIYDALTNSTDNTRVQPTNQICGEVSESTLPNNIFGYGLMDVFSSCKHKDINILKF